MVELLIGVAVGLLIMYAVLMAIIIKVFWAETRGKF